MSGLNMTDTKNTLAWVNECRRRNSNSIANTFTGKWLGIALKIIERQFKQIQDIRNEMIDRTPIERSSPEIVDLLHKLDSIQGGKYSLLSGECASTIRHLIAERDELLTPKAKP